MQYAGVCRIVQHDQQGFVAQESTNRAQRVRKRRRTAKVVQDVSEDEDIDPRSEFLEIGAAPVLVHVQDADVGKVTGLLAGFATALSDTSKPNTSASGGQQAIALTLCPSAQPISTMVCVESGSGATSASRLRAS